MAFGFEGKNGLTQEILDVFFGHGHSELDTAWMYAEGTTDRWGRLS
jgi:aflatoxin B1 aldehyde reductase